MAFCTNCGAVLVQQSQFCASCGKPVGAAATQASSGAAAGSGSSAPAVSRPVPPANSGTPQNRITGTTMPVLEFVLQPNDAIISEAGELSWMGSSIQLTTHTQFAGGGGLFGVLKRVAGGGSIFMTEYRAVGAAGELAFATKLPGHIVPVEVSPGCEYLIHRHGFLCATSQVQISVGFQQSLGAGVFGGDGFLLQKLSGQGTAWLELSGDGHARSSAGGNPARSSRPCRSVSGDGLVPDHDGSGHQEYDLRRGWNLSRRSHRPGKSLAADFARSQTGSRHREIYASRKHQADGRGRRGGRHCRLHPGGHALGMASPFPALATTQHGTLPPTKGAHAAKRSRGTLFNVLG